MREKQILSSVCLESRCEAALAPDSEVSAEHGQEQGAVKPLDRGQDRPHPSDLVQSGRSEAAVRFGGSPNSEAVGISEKEGVEVGG